MQKYLVKKMIEAYKAQKGPEPQEVIEMVRDGTRDVYVPLGEHHRIDRYV